MFYKRFSELKNRDSDVFRDIVGEIEEYVKTHNYIGKFPANQVKITRAVVEGRSESNSPKKKSKIDEELDAALRDVDDIRQNGISSMYDLTADSPELGGVVNYRAEQIEKEAEYTRERLKREAEERRELEEEADYDEPETKPADKYTVVTLRHKKNSYNFFDRIDSLWYGSTKITAVPNDRDLNISIARDYVVCAFLWAVLACVLLFTANLVLSGTVPWRRFSKTKYPLIPL